MNLPNDLRAWTKRLVQNYGFKAGERLGQHFLINKKVIQDILEAADLPAHARVLEVGGGFGVLTLPLLDYASRLVVVELDKRLVSGLQKIATTTSNLTVVEGDILKVPDIVMQEALQLPILNRESRIEKRNSKLMMHDSDFFLLSNLPYEISGAFLRRFLSGPWRPKRMMLLLQREVSERLITKPGDMSLLALQAQLACHNIQIISNVPPTAFWPEPRVNSCVVRFDLRSQLEYAQLLNGADITILWRLARVGFAARRKMLAKNLLAGFSISKIELHDILTKAHIPITARAQELSVEQWVSLAKNIEYKI